jgi:hypothetical protein
LGLVEVKQRIAKTTRVLSFNSPWLSRPRSSTSARARMPRADYIPTSGDSPPSVCPHCQQPMKLVPTTPSCGPAMPELLAYWCAACSYGETRKKEPSTQGTVHTGWTGFNRSGGAEFQSFENARRGRGRDRNTPPRCCLLIRPPAAAKSPKFVNRRIAYRRIRAAELYSLIVR